ncbi:hypothetical protein [Limnothrix sp. PR1529]|nr:hypothetical protein [Limnothrix sp. PR1529]
MHLTGDTLLIMHIESFRAAGDAGRYLAVDNAQRSIASSAVMRC